MHTAKVRVLDQLDLSHALTFVDSYVSSTQTDFPYLPRTVYRVSAESHAADRDSAWHLAADGRAASGANAGSPGILVGGYFALDLSGRLRLAREIELSARIDNVLDRGIEIVRDYPLPGRVYSVAAIGHW
jgi:outer membrane cobalamin receptor